MAARMGYVGPIIQVQKSKLVSIQACGGNKRSILSFHQFIAVNVCSMLQKYPGYFYALFITKFIYKYIVAYPVQGMRLFGVGLIIRQPFVCKRGVISKRLANGFLVIVCDKLSYIHSLSV